MRGMAYRLSVAIEAELMEGKHLGWVGKEKGNQGTKEREWGFIWSQNNGLPSTVM